MAAKKTNDSANALMRLSEEPLPQLDDDLAGLVVKSQGNQVQQSAEVAAQAAVSPDGNQTAGKGTKGENSVTVKESIVTDVTPELATSAEGMTLWTQFVDNCDKDKTLRKDLGKGGTARLMRIENDILDTLQLYRVNGHDASVMINSILRTFLVRYKKQFTSFRSKEKTSIY